MKTKTPVEILNTETLRDILHTVRVF